MKKILKWLIKKGWFRKEIEQAKSETLYMQGSVICPCGQFLKWGENAYDCNKKSKEHFERLTASDPEVLHSGTDCWRKHLPIINCRPPVGHQYNEWGCYSNCTGCTGKLNAECKCQEVRDELGQPHTMVKYCPLHKNQQHFCTASACYMNTT